MKLKTRAQATTEVLFILTEIVMVIAAGVVVFQKISDIDDGRLFLKKFFSRDLALAIDAVELLEGNVVYFYNPKLENEFLSGLNFKFGNGFVDVNNDKYPVASKSLNPSVVSAPENFLRITKVYGNLSVEEHEVGVAPKLRFNRFALDCSGFNSAKINSVVVDAGHGFNSDSERGFVGDVGFEGVAGRESLLVADVGANLLSSLRTAGFSAGFTRDPSLRVPGEDAKSVADRKSKIGSADALVSLHLNKEGAGLNNVKVFVNYDSSMYSESFKLACLIVNGLSGEFYSQVSGAVVVPVRLSQLDSDDAKQLLVSDRVAVLVELGNVDSQKSFVGDFVNVGKVIAGAVGDFSE